MIKPNFVFGLFGKVVSEEKIFFKKFTMWDSWMKTDAKWWQN